MSSVNCTAYKAPTSCLTHPAALLSLFNTTYLQVKQTSITLATHNLLSIKIENDTDQPLTHHVTSLHLVRDTGLKNGESLTPAGVLSSCSSEHTASLTLF